MNPHLNHPQRHKQHHPPQMKEKAKALNSQNRIEAEELSLPRAAGKEPEEEN